MSDDQTPSMSDSLNAAIETVGEAPSAEPAPQAPEPSAPADAGTQDSAAPQGVERARGPDGKYVRRDAQTEQTAAPGAQAPVAGSGQAPLAPAAAPAVPTDAAPPSWTPAAKEKWTTLDPTVKGEVQRREREIAVGMQRAADARQFGDSVMQEFVPYKEILAQEGATPQDAIRALLETSYTLRYGSPEHKKALFLSLAQQYNIDFSQQIDPEKARLQWELDSRQVQDARQAAAQQEALQRDVQGEIQSFMAGPGHEHYDNVRTAMAGLIQSGVATNLQDAYDRACWADPTIRSALMMAEYTRRATEQAKNRNALGAISGAPGAVSTGGPALDPTNLRGMLEAQFAGNAGRV